MQPSRMLGELLSGPPSDRVTNRMLTEIHDIQVMFPPEGKLNTTPARAIRTSINTPHPAESDAPVPA